MNDLAKKLLGSCSGESIPMTTEQREERDIRLRMARARADAWYLKYEEGQAVNIQRLLSSDARYSA